MICAGLELAPSFAVTVAVAETLTAFVFIVNRATEPPTLTETVAGTVTDGEFELVFTTTGPFAKLGMPFKVIVPAVFEPPVTTDGPMLSERTLNGSRDNVPVRVSPPAFAEIVKT